jgi:hypothetical protein
MLRSYLAFAIVGLVVSACATVSTSTSGGKYSEDLSAYRPATDQDDEKSDTVSIVVDEAVKERAQPSLNINNQLKATLDSVAAYKRETVNYIDGFTIQVYGGDSRATAREARMDVLRYFPDTEPQMIFDQPNYKVRLGKYYTRLEAQPLFMDIRRRFPTAILVPTRIKINN